MADFFEWLNSINNKTEPPEDQKSYNPFMVNRGLSYFADSVFWANEMNRYSHLDPDMQYQFLYNSVPKKKRFAKWAKPETEDTIEIIMQFYKVNRQEATAYRRFLTEEQLNTIKEQLFTGGRTK